MLDDDKVPESVRAGLADEFAEIRALLERLEQGQIHLAVFGRVSVGKTALVNALLGESRFEVSPLHGQTRSVQRAAWTDVQGQGVHLVDTPGIDELDGAARERLASQVADRADLVLFVCDGDLSEREHQAMMELAVRRRPLILVLNKSDRYTDRERELLLDRLRARAAPYLKAEDVLAVAAEPRPEIVIELDQQGREQRRERARPADLSALQMRVFDVLARDGRALLAVNASLLAADLSDQVAERLAELRKEIAARVVRSYCIAKGLTVATNPVPILDLFAAAGIDVALVVHLGRVYGLPLTRMEAGALIAAIAAQLTALMGVVWGIHVASSALKGLSVGLSTALTAGVQGAVAWYATLVVGRIAERYLVQGKSWGPNGPKAVIESILADIDRESVLADARADILKRLRAGKPRT